MLRKFALSLILIAWVLAILACECWDFLVFALIVTVLALAVAWRSMPPGTPTLAPVPVSVPVSILEN